MFIAKLQSKPPLNDHYILHHVYGLADTSEHMQILIYWVNFIG